VGYVSADLKTHVVTYTLEGVTANHDPRAIDLYLYAAVAQPDEVSRRLATFGAWRSIAGLDDAEAAALIRADEIDVLVVIAGHTAGNRPRVAAFRPAPVQISLYDLYDLSTSGLESVDGWITDAVLHPADTKERFTEELLRLPCWYLRPPLASSPELGPPPSETLGYVTFGSFNSIAKISDPVLDTWARILVAVPGSRIVFAFRDRYGDPYLVRHVRQRFARFGIGAERLALSSDFRSADEHLGLVASVDVALDTFPYGGANTTFDALWMGVPVVTYAGERFLGRMSASILTAIGEPSLIAGSIDDYVATAARLAGDRNELARLRRELRSRLVGSPICDPVGYARALEIVYRDVWRRRCA
jgi:protein O-GlcNAc transferase